LTSERDACALIISFQERLRADYPNGGLRLPDGSLLELQVELIDQQGKIHQLHIGAMGDEEIGFSEWDIPEGM
jgi:hypothetical protein